jgi:hypothetical protein
MNVIIPNGDYCTGCKFLCWETCGCQIFEAGLKYSVINARFIKCEKCLNKETINIEYQEEVSNVE